MNTPPQCSRCDLAMQEGFVVVTSFGGPVVSHWTAGKPVRSVWTGLKLNEEDKRLVTTFRCPGCGYLESYALEEN